MKEKIVIAIIAVLLLLIGIPFYMKKLAARRAATCLQHLRRIDGAKEQWAMGTSHTNGDPVNMSAVLQYLDGKKLPTCPSEGKYLIGFIGGAPVCTIHGNPDIRQRARDYELELAESMREAEKAEQHYQKLRKRN